MSNNVRFKLNKEEHQEVMALLNEFNKNSEEKLDIHQYAYRVTLGSINDLKDLGVFINLNEDEKHFITQVYTFLNKNKKGLDLDLHKFSYLATIEKAKELAAEINAQAAQIREQQAAAKQAAEEKASAQENLQPAESNNTVQASGSESIPSAE